MSSSLCHAPCSLLLAPCSKPTIMRHRRKGRILGRNPNHQRALLRGLASALILTEAHYDDDDKSKPKVKGRIVTTIQKAKEVRPLVERCITIAIRALPQIEAAAELEPEGERNSEAWKKWRHGPEWNEWNQAIAPVVAARRRTLQLLGSKQAVQVLFSDIAPRFSDRPGGYTRVLRLAKPRLGDAGVRAILEFVGVHDRKRRKAARPAFDTETETPASQETAETETTEATEGTAE
jgi:large subunit ribosomal protein L17